MWQICRMGISEEGAVLEGDLHGGWVKNRVILWCLRHLHINWFQIFVLLLKLIYKLFKLILLNSFNLFCLLVDLYWVILCFYVQLLCLWIYLYIRPNLCTFEWVIRDHWMIPWVSHQIILLMIIHMDLHFAVVSNGSSMLHPSSFFLSFDCSVKCCFLPG